jgi:hypothetical protein
MRSFALLLTLGLAAAMLGPIPTAFAWPVIEVTGTEPSGSPDFPLVQTNFTVDYVGPGPASDLILVSRTDGLQIFGCAAPAGWECNWFPKTPGGATFRRLDGGPLPPPALSFAIKTMTAGPCVLFEFRTRPYETNDYVVSGCLLVDGPVPARRMSWGGVKSLHR